MPAPSSSTPSSASSSAPSSAVPSDLAARFDTFCRAVEVEQARLAVPGVAVGILHQGEELTAGFGVTNVNHPLSVDADTLFQIGSTTKTVTATVAMQLVEAGKLDLDTPVQTYLPDFRLGDAQTAAQVTLRHLFTHCGGWVGDFFLDTGRGDDAVARYVERMVDLPQEFPLGTAFAYNNAAYCLAGLIVQTVCDKPYEQVVREMLLDPLEMDMSFFFPEEVIVHRTAVGHQTSDAGENSVAQPWALPRSAHPAGGITASIHDQLRYARFHLGDGTTPGGKRLLSAASLTAMQTTQRAAASMAQEVAISWLIRQRGGLRMVGHGGATTSQFSAFELVPSHSFALAINTNGSRGRILNSVITRRALEIFLDAHVPQPQPIQFDAATLAAYAGTYRAALADVSVTVEGDGLQLASQPKGGFPTQDTPAPPAPPPCHFVFTGPRHIYAPSGSMQESVGEFLINDDGSIRALHLGGRIYHRAPEDV